MFETGYFKGVTENRIGAPQAKFWKSGVRAAGEILKFCEDFKRMSYSFKPILLNMMKNPKILLKKFF